MQTVSSCGSALNPLGIAVDVALIVLLVLSVLFSAKKGFLGVIVGFVGGFVAVVAATFLCSPISKMLSGIGLDDTITELFSSIFSNGVFSQTLAELGEGGVDAIIAELGMPSALNDSIKSLLMEKLASLSLSSTLTVGDVLSEKLAGLLLSVISFFTVFIIITIVVAVLKKYAKKINEVPLIGPVNKFLGGAIGLVSGVVAVIIVTFPLAIMGGFFPEQINPLVDGTVILKLLYNYNPIALVAYKLLI